MKWIGIAITIKGLWMDDIIRVAEETQKRAWDVVHRLKVFEAWQSVGAEINLIGSLKTGLLIRNLDIDFNIYTDPFALADSFLAITRIAEVKGVKRITFKNLLDTDERCLEWHAWYNDPVGSTWQIDMIHISYDSPYAGVFERVAERICQILNPDTRRAILAIKNAAPPGDKVKGIEVNMAVIRDGVRTYAGFLDWRQGQQHPEIIVWEP